MSHCKGWDLWGRDRLLTSCVASDELKQNRVRNLCYSGFNHSYYFFVLCQLDQLLLVCHSGSLQSFIINKIYSKTEMLTYICQSSCFISFALSLSFSFLLHILPILFCFCCSSFPVGKHCTIPGANIISKFHS